MPSLVMRKDVQLEFLLTSLWYNFKSKTGKPREILYLYSLLGTPKFLTKKQVKQISINTVLDVAVYILYNGLYK